METSAGNEARRLGQDWRAPVRYWRAEAPWRQGAGAFCVAHCVTLSVLYVHLLCPLRILSLSEKWFQVLKNKKKKTKQKTVAEETENNFYPMILLCKLGWGRPVFAFYHAGLSWGGSVGELLRVLSREQGAPVLNKALIEEICKHLIISFQPQNKDYVGLSFVGQSYR